MHEIHNHYPPSELGLHQRSAETPLRFNQGSHARWSCSTALNALSCPLSRQLPLPYYTPEGAWTIHWDNEPTSGLESHGPAGYSLPAENLFHCCSHEIHNHTNDKNYDETDCNDRHLILLNE